MESIQDSEKVAMAALPVQPFNMMSAPLNPMMMQSSDGRFLSSPMNQSYLSPRQTNHMSLD